MLHGYMVYRNVGTSVVRVNVLGLTLPIGLQLITFTLECLDHGRCMILKLKSYNIYIQRPLLP